MFDGAKRLFGLHDIIRVASDVRWGCGRKLRKTSRDRTMYSERHDSPEMLDRISRNAVRRNTSARTRSVRSEWERSAGAEEGKFPHYVCVAKATLH